MLYVVATPIGNLEDITFRAARILREVDLVVAEDTRRSRILLTHLNITAKHVERLDAHASQHDIDRVIRKLNEGQSVALVTDAGTPSVSDPGMALVKAAHQAQIKVVPIPGPSAVATAVAASGLVDGPFRFAGFLPRSGPERSEALATIVASIEPVILYEAPNRVSDTLADLAERCPNRQAMLGRELTKLHEELLLGTLKELSSLEREWMGEFTIVIGPGEKKPEIAPDENTIETWIDEQLTQGHSAKDTADIVAARTGMSRREIYAKVVARKAKR